MERQAGATHVTFAQRLEAWKSRGANVLVVGTSAPRAHAAACERLLGDEGANTRAESERIHHRILLAVGDPVHTSIDGDDGPEPYTDVISSESIEATGGSPLGRVGGALVETIDRIEGDVGALQAGALRVCIDSGATLLDRHDTQSAFRMLHLATSRIGKSRGIGHLHLPVSPDHDAVSLLEPLFDATLEVRETDGAYEQRWRVDNGETEWLALDSA